MLVSHMDGVHMLIVAKFILENALGVLLQIGQDNVFDITLELVFACWAIGFNYCFLLDLHFLSMQQKGDPMEPKT